MKIILCKNSDIWEEFDKEWMHSYIPEYRKKAVDCLHNENDKERSLMASFLLMVAFLEENKNPYVSPSMQKNGKMYFPQYHDFFINLSHASDYAACVWDNADVGIDLEATRKSKENVLKKIASSKEQEEYERLLKKDVYEADRFFTALWTKKESIVKLSGRGISALVAENHSEESDIFTKTFEPLKDVFISVSSKEKIEDAFVRVLSRESLAQWHQQLNQYFHQRTDCLNPN